MRNPEFSEADAAGVVNELLKKLSARPADPQQGQQRSSRIVSEQQPMSIVEVTEALLRQIDSRKKP